MIKKFLLVGLVVCGVGEPFIDQSDRAALELFFQEVLLQEEFGYVLLGEKPMAFSSYVVWSWKSPFRSLLSLRTIYSTSNQAKANGWTAWKKYIPFVSSQFVFLEEPSPYSPNTVWIYLIHRDLFCQTVDSHASEFETALGHPVTGKELLDETSQHTLFSEALLKHEGLLGLLLGYGKKNAWLFYENKLDALGYFPKQEDKIDEIALPSFRANWSDPETLHLRKTYLDGREKIKQAFLYKESLLDTSLHILTDSEK